MNEAYAKFVASRTPESYTDLGAIPNKQGMSIKQCDDVIHAVFGLATEGAEALDCLKSTFAYKRPLDLVNLDEEFGDALWFIQLYCNARGLSFEQLIVMNTAKLETRYPNGFSYLEALNRDLGQERAVLEAHSDGQTT